MTKTQLVMQIAETTNMSKSDVEHFLEAFLSAVTDVLKEGDELRLVGFGTFKTRNRKASTARNPQTGHAIEVGESIVPVFKPGKTLKDALNPEETKKQSANHAKDGHANKDSHASHAGHAKNNHAKDHHK